MNELLGKPERDLEWEQLRPVLDDALAALGESDRAAILLRFFEGRGVTEVGARLSLTVHAARMRVDRALEKLRERLSRTGVRSTTAALALVLANQAITAAPAGLVLSVSGTALATASVSGAAGVITFMSLTKLQIGIAAAVVATGAAGLVVQENNRTEMKRELAALAQDRRIAVPSRSPIAAAPAASPISAKSLDADAELARLADETATLRQAMTTAQAGAKQASGNARGAGAAPTAKDAPQLDRAPLVLVRKPPAYPAEFRATGTAGSVVVEFVVDASGAVKNAVAVSSTNPGFEAAAVAAVASWQYQAGSKGGRAVNTKVQQVITFSVSKNATPQSNWF